MRDADFCHSALVAESIAIFWISFAEPKGLSASQLRQGFVEQRLRNDKRLLFEK